MIQKTLIASAISLVMLSACSDNNMNAVQTGEGTSDGGNINPVDPNPQAQQRELQQLENSDAFFTALRDGLIKQNANTGRFGTDDSIAPVLELGVAAPTTDSAQDLAAGDEQAGSAPADVTTTNVQEIGVDEQDRMKSDGEFLYILENQYGNYYPVEVDGPEPIVSLPVDLVQEPAVVDQAEPVDPANDEFAIDLLPVTPSTDSLIAVPNFPDLKTKLRILALQNEAPDAQSIIDLTLDLGGAAADGMYLYKADQKRNIIITSTSYRNFYDTWNDSYSFTNNTSLISKLDVTDPMQSNMVDAIRIDGSIISSRRIGDTLFVASRFYPSIPGIDPYLATPEQYQAAVEELDLSTVLPSVTQSDRAPVPLINPGECFVAARGQAQDYYYTPDIVTLSVFDLNSFELKDSECFLGATETLYATKNAVYLATTRWDYGAYPAIDLDDQTSPVAYIDPRVDTDIHQFTINGTELNYSGSGVVSGHLGWNPDRKPFRMSEKDNYLRVATFSEAQNESVSPINVTVLDVSGDGELKTAAELPNANNPEHIGKPGEQLYASRFLGNKGYLVTFRQTDPLYVIDFSNPTDPKLAGELEIDGYSDYLHPIGEDFLLGIGKDAVPAGNGGGDRDGAWQQGIKLSLFNVADASNPIEVQSLVIGERGTEAVALRNHRAITVQAATDTHPTRVAFGIDVAGLSEPRQVSDPSFWYPWNFTGLHGFDINVGDGASIERRGAMVVNSASNPNPSAFGYYGDDRSVIVGDSVYYIHGSDVYAADWSDLGNFSGPR